MIKLECLVILWYRSLEIYLILFKVNRDVIFFVYLSLLNKIYIYYINGWFSDLYYIYVTGEIINGYLN